MKFGIVVFPGSNCDEDAFHAARDVFGQDAEYLWHKDADLKGVDVVILPGGFAHGDYLRTGAMARFSPIMAPVRAFAERGGPVLGICNGARNVVGMMPHPERACEALLGGVDGCVIFDSIVRAFRSADSLALQR